MFKDSAFQLPGGLSLAVVRKAQSKAARQTKERLSFFLCRPASHSESQLSCPGSGSTRVGENEVLMYSFWTIFPIMLGV